MSNLYNVYCPECNQSNLFNEPSSCEWICEWCGFDIKESEDVFFDAFLSSKKYG